MREFDNATTRSKEIERRLQTYHREIRNQRAPKNDVQSMRIQIAEKENAV
jgi:uncharacterized protein YggE